MSKQVWQAKDGELFNSEEECLLHERACLFLNDMNHSEYVRNEKRWGMQKDFSRRFLEGFQSKSDFWKYSDSFRTLADILDGKRLDLPRNNPPS
ncbi:hypothetical protein [Prochlorococcus sp. MIT 1307]|uniref:hypothetical protein n=1 Tax=Prochlorococcus sp. MIT 1307 TaxID=3096219 RepID=UPI002A74B5B4|nr:hypothetical protein [Prochlorococcus sp. MIT 1307]